MPRYVKSPVESKKFLVLVLFSSHKIEDNH